MRRTGKSVVERVLSRLADQETKAQTYDQRLIYRAAYMTVHQAFFGDGTDPFRQVVVRLLRRNEHFEPSITLAARASSPPPAPPPGIHIVDGRNAAQWHESVKAYLHYRSGSAWRRRPSARQHPEYEIYTCAIFELNRAFHSPERPRTVAAGAVTEMPKAMARAA